MGNHPLSAKNEGEFPPGSDISDEASDGDPLNNFSAPRADSSRISLQPLTVLRPNAMKKGKF
jgi:hypothetical protein